MKTKELEKFVSTKNQINTVLNALVPELHEILEKNPLQFKKDCTLTKKSKDLFDNAIAQIKTKFNDNKIRIWIDNQCYNWANSLSGSIYTMIDSNYLSDPDKNGVCSTFYVKNYVYLWDIAKNQKSNFVPIQMISVQLLEDAQIRIRELDTQIGSLTSERNKLKSLLELG